jgi:hypothetical protein
MYTKTDIILERRSCEKKYHAKRTTKHGFYVSEETQLEQALELLEAIRDARQERLHNELTLKVGGTI